MSKYRFKYEYTLQYGSPHHIWSAVGAAGGVHFHVSNYGDNPKQGSDAYSGGIETHWRTPPSCFKDDPPSQDTCWLLKAPCWHDGSSLQASEHWIPVWLSDPNNHDRIFRMLEAHADSMFGLDSPDTSP